VTNDDVVVPPAGTVVAVVSPAPPAGSVVAVAPAPPAGSVVAVAPAPPAGSVVAVAPPGVELATLIFHTFFAPTFEHTKTVDFFLIFTVNTCPTVLHEAPGRFAEAMVEGTNVRRRTARTARLVSFNMEFKVITQGHVAGGYAFRDGSPWAMPNSADR
jgi:hypothetical protein